MYRYEEGMKNDGAEKKGFPVVLKFQMSMSMGLDAVEKKKRVNGLGYNR